MSNTPDRAPSILSDEEVDRTLAGERGWRRQGDSLVRELQLPDFDEALRCVERLAQLVNDYGRRPDMCISEFNRVRLSISNLHHAGFTLAEMRLAAKVNAVIEETHPGHPEDPDHPDHPEAGAATEK
jgi:4a-hydroxytetrahydrobiopterin dehydratase